MPADKSQFKRTAEQIVSMQEKKAAIRAEIAPIRRLWHSIRHSPLENSKAVRERYAELVHELLKLRVSLQRPTKRNHSKFKTLMQNHALILELQHDVDFLSDTLEGD